MSSLIIKTIWYILPGFIGNMSPIFATKIFKNKFSYPMDFGLKFRKERVLGKNKTWRGLFFSILIAILIVYIQTNLYLSGKTVEISVIDYSKTNFLFLGSLMGFAAIFGDALKSFFKRRFKTKPSERWIPFDQLDVPLGFSFFVYPFIPTPTNIIVMSFIISPIFSFITSQLGFIFKIKNTRW